MPGLLWSLVLFHSKEVNGFPINTYGNDKMIDTIVFNVPRRFGLLWSSV